MYKRKKLNRGDNNARNRNVSRIEGVHLHEAARHPRAAPVGQQVEELLTNYSVQFATASLLGKVLIVSVTQLIAITEADQRLPELRKILAQVSREARQ